MGSHFELFELITAKNDDSSGVILIHQQVDDFIAEGTCAFSDQDT